MSESRPLWRWPTPTLSKQLQSWDETPADRELVSSSALWLCPITPLSLFLSLSFSHSLSHPGRLVRGCQTVCQPMASSLRGQSSRSSWGKPPPCRNSPFAYGCRAGREGRRGRKVERAQRLIQCGDLKANEFFLISGFFWAFFIIFRQRKKVW